MVDTVPGWTTYARIISAGAGTNFELFIPYDTRRSQLHFFCIGNVLPISPYAAVNEYGYFVIPASVNTIMSLTDHGPMVYGPWYFPQGVSFELYVIQCFTGQWSPPGGQSLREINEAVKKQCAANRGAVQVRESVLQRLHNASNSVRRSASERIGANRVNPLARR
jgi:hypothetical protein